MSNASALIATDHSSHLDTFLGKEGPVTDITVNGVAINKDALRLELQNHPADSIEEAAFNAARGLVLRELLLQQVRKLGLIGNNEEVAANDIDGLISELINREVPEQKSHHRRVQTLLRCKPRSLLHPAINAGAPYLIAGVSRCH